MICEEGKADEVRCHERGKEFLGNKVMIKVLREI